MASIATVYRRIVHVHVTGGSSRGQGERAPRRQAPRDVSVLSVLRRLRARQQLLHLPSQRLRPLSGQRLGKRLVALELAGPLAAALRDVPVAEGAAAGAE